MRRRSAVSFSLRLLAATLACGAALAPARPSRALPGRVDLRACLGHWVGTGTQRGIPPWSIDMAVTKIAGADCGTIEYPSLRCGGVLASCETRGATVHFVERYTHNDLSRCSPPGVIDATCVTSSMRWVWSGEEIVRTTLRRQ